ncbi:MAG: DUF2125 domain-containing protein [Pseudomonadota bacterium]
MMPAPLSRKMARLALPTAAILTLALAPVAGLAKTPAEAWQDLQDMAEDADVSVVAASERTTGDGLIVSGIAYTSELEDEATLTGTVDEIRFTDAGDGTVTVTMSETLPFSVAGTDLEGRAFNVSLTLAAPDFVYTVGDLEGGGTDATYAGPEITLTMDSVTEDGEVMDVGASMSMTKIGGAFSMSDDEPMETVSEITAAAFAFDLAGTDPDTGGEFDFAVSIEDIASNSTTVGGSPFAIYGDLGALIEDGFGTDGEGSVGPVAIAISVNEAPDIFDLAITMDGGRGTATLNDARIEYDVEYSGVAFTASGSQIPFPQVTGSLGSSSTVFEVPSTPSDEMAPMSLVVGLRDLVLGEEIWSLFDPTSALPRDPLTLVMDLSGQMRLLTDLFEEEIFFESQPPVEVDTLNINELVLSMVGAELTGSGAFTFDNEAESGPFGEGIPPIDGTVNLTLIGAQTLLDTLVTMGLVSGDQAMMARMMTGMLAVPGEGPDTLLSEITVQPDGTILANGAPLPF